MWVELEHGGGAIELGNALYGKAGSGRIVRFAAMPARKEKG